MVKQEEKGLYFKAFLPDARILSKEEIDMLTDEKTAAVKSDGAKGIWVEVFCPEGSCSKKRDRITIPAKGFTTEEKKGVWLNLFCSEDQCMVEDPTDLS
ncbi:MAG: hypothetical protein GY846_03500 [Deltaproteobacteria bacterium]|nr:hypothetical protein [Deltaproteobacteria bacterium]